MTFRETLLDTIEAQTILEPNVSPAQIFGDMIQLAVMGLFDMAPNDEEAFAVLNQAVKNGLRDHMED